MIKNKLFEECLADVDPKVRQEVRMKMERQKTYWTIGNSGSVFEIYDQNHPFDDFRYEIGNYFATRSQAEEMARKLKAVLKGAEVIEMPSEKEISLQSQREWVANDGEVGDKRVFNDIVLTAYSIVKSKIVK